MTTIPVSLIAAALALQPSQETVIPPPLDSTVVVVSGQVRGTGDPGADHLPGAFLEVRQGDRSWIAIADEEGRYRVAGLGEGRVRVSAFHLSAHRLEVELFLPSSGEVRLDLELEVRPIHLPALIVRGEVVGESIRAESLSPVRVSGLSDLTRLTLAASNGIVQSGLRPSLPEPPPGEDQGQPSRTLFTRGSTLDSRQFLLDGAPILTPFHLSGLLPPFDSRVIGTADLYVGGAPARYEGGLSHVLDLATRHPGELGVAGDVSLDGVALRGSLEIPLPLAGGLLATGRLLHGGAGFLSLGGEHPYGFGDFLVRGELRPGGDQRFSITGFGNRESLRLDGVQEVEWGNRALSLGWSKWFGRTSVGISSAVTHYNASLPVAWFESLQARSDAYQSRVSLLIRTPWKEGEIQFGSSVDRQDFRYRLSPAGRTVLGTDSGPWVGLTRVETAPERITGDRVGAFIEIHRPVGDGGGEVRIGGRIDHFDVDERIRLAPRGSFTYPLTSDARLTLSGGRYHQQIAVPGLFAATGGTEVPEIFWSPNFRVASADHLVVSLDQTLSPNMALGISGFVKHFQGMLPDRDRRVNASGTDLRIGWEGTRIEGWMGYTISWFWEESGTANAATFSGRHLLATGASIRNVHDLTLGFSLGYGSGLPLTPVGNLPEEELLSTGSGDGDRRLLRMDRTTPVGTLAFANTGAPLDVTREESFLRLDLEVAWNRTHRIRGRSVEFRPYLRILNALNRRDSLFYSFDRWMDDELRPLTERPFLPLIGVEWRF